MIKFRTLQRLCLVALALALVVPVAAILALAAYYRGSAYRARVARDLAEALGTRVSIGRLERAGRHDLRLEMVAIGGTREAPLIAARHAALRCDTPGARRSSLLLDDARLSLRSRRDLDEVLALVASAGRDQRLLASVRLRGAAVTAAPEFQLDVHTMDGGIDFAPTADGRSGEAALLRDGRVVCRIGARVSGGAGSAVRLEDVPAALLQAVGLAADLPLESARVSGDATLADGPVTVDVRLRSLETARLGAGWGIPGVSGPVTVALAGTFGERGQLRPTRVQVLGGGHGLEVDRRALHRLAYLLVAETPDGESGDSMPDVPSEAGARHPMLSPDSLPFVIDRLDASVTIEGDRVTVAGGALEPAGTILTGALRGEERPCPLLRLNRTHFHLDELAERLQDVRAGKADRRAPTDVLTTRATSRPASRPSP